MQTSSQWRHNVQQGKTSFSYMGPNVKESIFGYSGGGGGVWVAQKYTYQSIPISIYIKIWKQSVQDFLSYRVHKEISADSAA